MIFHRITVDRVTSEQVAAVRQIIPNIDAREVTNEFQAIEAAVARTRATLPEGRSVTPGRTLVRLSPNETIDPNDRRKCNYVRRTDSGWEFFLLVTKY